MPQLGSKVDVVFWGVIHAGKTVTCLSQSETSESLKALSNMSTRTVERKKMGERKENEYTEVFGVR